MDTDYLLIREAAPLLGLKPWNLRKQIERGLIPEKFLLRSGDARPVIRIHRAWFGRFNETSAPVLTATAAFAWEPAHV